MPQKYVYFFGGGKAEGDAKMKELLGGKGANLAEMVNIKLPVPAGFTITTEVCTYYYAHKKKFPPELKSQVLDSLRKTEKVMGCKFGDVKNPLLVSVRSGARASMPGMMDTILNLGLNDKTVAGLIKKTNNPRFVYDSYRRFVQMYGDVVLDLKPTNKHQIDPFEEIIEHKKKNKGITNDLDFTADDLRDLAIEFKAAIKKGTGEEGIFSQGKKKGSDKNKFNYRVTGQELQFLDKKSGMATQRFIIDELSATTLRFHNALKDCEVKTFTRLE